jgi:hypothetical protein
VPSAYCLAKLAASVLCGAGLLGLENCDAVKEGGGVTSGYFHR